MDKDKNKRIGSTNNRYSLTRVEHSKLLSCSVSYEKKFRAGLCVLSSKRVKSLWTILPMRAMKTELELLRLRYNEVSKRHIVHRI
ncbi:hypothetical protein [Peijinzhouia sedimentorum]